MLLYFASRIAGKMHKNNIATIVFSRLESAAFKVKLHIIVNLSFSEKNT